MKQDEAIAMGAMALFGEKYGENVRVVSVGDWAHELCGGTHASHSAQLGLVKFLSESSIGAGIRRVEALVGTDAYQFLAREHLLVQQLTQLTKARPEELPERIEQVLIRLKNAERELQQMKASQLMAKVDDIIGTGADIGPVRLWSFTAPAGVAASDLRDLVNRAKGMANPDLAVCIFGTAVHDGRVSLVAAANDHAVAAGVTARDLLNAAAPAVDGRGGGKDQLAQGGGSKPEGVPLAQEAVAALVRSRVA
jgi:alanyl-tRNA synthetase